MAVVARALELGGREVRSGVDRRGRDDAVTRPQQQDRRLRDDEGGNDGHGNPAGAFHVRKECPHGPSRPRDPCRSRSSPTSTATATPSRRCSPTSQRGPARGDLVPGRRRRLRRRPQRLLPRSRASTPTSAWPATTTSRSPASSTLDEFSRGAALAARWTQEVIDADHRDWLACAEARRASERDVGLYHASPRDPIWEYVLSRPAGRAVPRRPARAPVAWSATRTSRSRFVRPEGEPATGAARRGGEERRRRRRRVAAQPRQRRPAARRRPARRLAAARHRAPGPPRWRRTEYDVAGAAAAIRAARLPDSLAERLEYGQ